MLTFDEKEHVYFWHGERVANTTRIIAPLVDYSFVDALKLEIARQQGVAIHRMVELEIRGELDALPAWLEPYLKAWRKFVADTGFLCWLSETRVFHPMLRYATTPDLCGELPLIKIASAVIEIKRSFAAGLAVGVQTAAQKAALEANKDYPRIAHRLGLQLRESGDYRLQRYEDKDDFPVFLACLSMMRWREKHGLPTP